MSNKMDTKFCYKCGEEEPSYQVVGYLRNCLCCGGRGGVMEVREMMDYMNEQNLRGLINNKLVEDCIDEEYSEPELDFNDDDYLLAEADAKNDYLDDLEEEL